MIEAYKFHPYSYRMFLHHNHLGIYIFYLAHSLYNNLHNSFQTSVFIVVLWLKLLGICNFLWQKHASVLLYRDNGLLHILHNLLVAPYLGLELQLLNSSRYLGVFSIIGTPDYFLSNIKSCVTISTMSFLIILPSIGMGMICIAHTLFPTFRTFQAAIS